MLSNFKSSVIFEEATITRKNEHNWNPVKYLNVLHHSRTQNYIVKILLTSYFGYFGHVWSTPSTTIMPTCRNFDVNLHVKISTPSLTFYWDIIKILQLCYFESFENAWSCPSIMIVPPYRKLWCWNCWNQLVWNFDLYMHAKNQLHSFFFEIL